jgi:hypothetical protein
VTEAPVRLLKAGARNSRCASFQVPGKVAATSVLPCAHKDTGKDTGMSAAAPNVAPVPSK